MVSTLNKIKNNDFIFIRPESYLSTFLSNSSSGNLNVNGSITPQDFIYTIPQNKKLLIRRFLIDIKDGTTDFQDNNFGQITSLTNGIDIILKHNGTETILENWKTNADIRITMFDFDNKFKTAGSYVGRWSLFKDVDSSGIVLNSDDKIIFRVKDDLTLITNLKIKLKGYLF